MSELNGIKDKWKHIYIVKIFFKLAITVEVLMQMMIKRQGWSEAVATVDYRYYQKCLNTGKENFLYRPALEGTTEVGPQSTGAFEGINWLQIILLIIAIYWLFKKAKQ